MFFIYFIWITLTTTDNKSTVPLLEIEIADLQQGSWAALYDAITGVSRDGSNNYDVIDTAGFGDVAIQLTARTKDTIKHVSFKACKCKYLNVKVKNTENLNWYTF